jgi:hypothetical protein
MKELNPLKTALGIVRLTVQEKEQGRREFIAFMEKKSFLSRFFGSMRRPAMSLAASLGILAVFSSGVSYAAESSLPGDTLYPIKVEVNEEVQEFFRFTPEAKAEWDLERMARRMAEAEELSTQGKLSEKAKIELKAKLKEHGDEMNFRLEELKASGAEEQSTQLSDKRKALFDLHQTATQELQAP